MRQEMFVIISLIFLGLGILKYIKSTKKNTEPLLATVKEIGVEI
jgi:hypothetical protein